MRKQLFVLSTVTLTVPVLLGILFSFLIGSNTLPIPLYQIMLRMDIAALVFWLGVSISLVVLGLLVLRSRVNRLVSRARVEEASAQQAANRRLLEELDRQQQAANRRFCQGRRESVPLGRSNSVPPEMLSRR